jgi:hypothetical protein
MRRIIIVVLIAALGGWWFPKTAAAQDGGSKIIFKDGIYGGLAGTLVGAALLAFRDHPKDHLDLVAKGAAVGVIAGVAFGFYDTSRSVAELENGNVYVRIPAPRYDIETGPTGKNSFGARVNLFTWRY